MFSCSVFVKLSILTPNLILVIVELISSLEIEPLPLAIPPRKGTTFISAPASTFPATSSFEDVVTATSNSTDLDSWVFATLTSLLSSEI